MTRYDEPEPGEWIRPKAEGFKLACCDCGLVHVHDYRIVDGHVEFRVFPAPRETGQNREETDHAFVPRSTSRDSEADDFAGERWPEVPPTSRDSEVREAIDGYEVRTWVQHKPSGVVVLKGHPQLGGRYCKTDGGDWPCAAVRAAIEQEAHRG